MSGTKVTTDSGSYDDPKVENPGVVTSDSLAAESVEEGGTFAATSKERGVLQQPSSSTTSNTTDTSSATRLDPASSRAERTDPVDQQDSLGGPGISQSAFAGNGGSSGLEDTSRSSGGSDDGGITGDEPNASWGTDIGGKNDPGRAAVRKLGEDAAASGSADGGRQYKVDNENPYNELGGSTSA